MLSRLLFSLLLVIVLPYYVEAHADQAATDVTPQPAETAAPGHDSEQVRMAKPTTKLMQEAPESLRNKLKVEKVLVKGPGENGIEIEVRYRIIDAKAYAGHPKATFVADETSKTLVPLTKLAKLFLPQPAEQAMQQPPAVLTLWDREGVIRPGQPVTVVVAGYGQKHVIPEAGPGYDTSAYASGNTVLREEQAQSDDKKLEVISAVLVAGGHLMKVKYHSTGIDALNTNVNVTYVEASETGVRHGIAQIPRLGALAPRDLGDNAYSYMVMDTAGPAFKPGDKIIVSVNGVRDEDVTVTAESAYRSPIEANAEDKSNNMKSEEEHENDNQH